MGGLLKLRIEPGDASESWKRSEGRTVAEKFQLLGYLAGSDDSAVFLTSIQLEGQSREAVIKLIYVGAADAENQLLQWESARELNHPNLLRIFEAGRCEIEGMQLLYVVQEYAEENLAQILPERALTPEETRELLPPVLSVLQYLHDKGFAHGRLQPSNILAIGNQVKLSSDGLARLGEKGYRRSGAYIYDPPESASSGASAAGDVWRMGVTLTEVLTQQLPAWDRSRTKSPEIPRSLPEPFREIVKHCLQIEPDKRWGVAEILHYLEPERVEAAHLESRPPAWALVPNENFQTQKNHASPLPVALAQQKPRGRWLYASALVALIAVGLLLILRPKGPTPTPATQSSQQPSASGILQKSGGAELLPAQPAAGSPAGAVDSANNVASSSVPQDGVVRRVVPDISSAARRTIRGRIVVRVKVRVDAAGDVTNATLQSGRGSRYFSRMALASARDWKFSPQPPGQSDDRQWNLQFAFTRAKTETSAAEVNR
jgi:TonB family protein